VWSGQIRRWQDAVSHYYMCILPIIILALIVFIECWSVFAMKLLARAIVTPNVTTPHVARVLHECFAYHCLLDHWYMVYQSSLSTSGANTYLWLHMTASLPRAMLSSADDWWSKASCRQWWGGYGLWLSQTNLSDVSGRLASRQPCNFMLWKGDSAEISAFPVRPTLRNIGAAFSTSRHVCFL
jgi:hypothetical protein